MAPQHNQLHLTPSTEHRRCSKAQMCFFNILHIISVFPALDVTNNNRLEQISENKRLVVDLNDAVSENCVLEKDDRSKSEPESDLAKDEEEERATEHSEISHVGDQSSGIEEEKSRDEGYLGLLIKAAQLILGADCEPDNKPPRSATARGGAKRKQQCWTAATEAEWYAEFEDTSPVVKSKRGRNQVLPFKYRDSVVEPLVRWTSSCKSLSKRRSK